MSRRSRKAKYRARLGGYPRPRNEAQAQLFHRVRAELQNVKFVTRSRSEKMSEVLLKFAEPILDLSASREEIRLTLQFAMSIWNYTLLPEPVRSTPPNSLVELMKDPIERAEINLLIQRKAELFPENDRIFMDLEISETGSDFRLNVVSCEQAKPRE